MKQETKYAILFTIFLTCLLVANIIASKLFMIGSIAITAGIIMYPITFLFTDVVAEVFGKKRATRAVWMGFLANIVMVLAFTAAIAIRPAPFWEGQAAFVSILGAVPRIVGASLVSYLISQTHDVWAFNFWKKRTRGKHLWLRNNASTMVSQAIDTFIFISLAFWGIVPLSVMWNMMLMQYLIKLAIAAVDTPFCYLLVNWLSATPRRRNKGKC